MYDCQQKKKINKSQQKYACNNNNNHKWELQLRIIDVDHSLRVYYSRVF